MPDPLNEIDPELQALSGITAHPNTASLVSRYTRRPAPSAPADLSSWGIPPEEAAALSQIGGTNTADEAYVQALPSQQQVGQAVEEQRATMPWWRKMLQEMDVFTLGQSVKGFFAGLHNGLWEGVSGFVRNLPVLFDVIGQEVQASDIRKAWGEENTEKGFMNGVLNTAIDVALSPLTYIAPFAKVGGAAEAVVAGTSEARIASAVAAGAAPAVAKAAEAAKMAEGLLSIGKGLETGQRAMAVFKIPWGPSFALGHIVPGTNPNGFQSIYVPIGNALDTLFNTLHTSPLTKPIAGIFTLATGVGDPLKRGIFRKAVSEAEQTRLATMSILENGLLKGTTPELRAMIAGNKDSHDALLFMRQVGITEGDNAASFARAVEDPTKFRGDAMVQALLKKDPVFTELYTTALAEAETGASTSAIEELYRKYPTVPLTPEMLDHADLPVRYGIDTSAFNSPSFVHTVAGAMGETAPSAGLRARVESAEAVRGKVAQAVAESNKGIMSSYETLQSLVAKGETSWKEINRYLESSAETMDALHQTEVIGRLVSTSMEPAVGPYVAKFANPDVLRAIDKQVFRQIEAYGGHKAINILQGFMRDPHYSTLTTAEANAVFWNLGTQITNFRPVKDIVEEQAHSLIDRVSSKIFDLPFIRALRNQDEKAAEFFLTNPVLNDYRRFWDSAEAAGGRAAFKALFHPDSPMKVATIDATDYAQRAKYDNPALNLVRVIESQEPQEIVKSAGYGTLEFMDIAHQGDITLARDMLRKDLAFRFHTKLDGPEGALGKLTAALKSVKIGAHSSDLAIRETDDVMTATLKSYVSNHTEFGKKLDSIDALEEYLGNVSAQGKPLAAHANEAAKQRWLQGRYEAQNLATEWEALGPRRMATIKDRIATAQSHKEALYGDLVQARADKAILGGVGRSSAAESGGLAIKPKQGHLYRTIESSEDLIDPAKATLSAEGYSQGPLKWSPTNRAAYKDLTHASTEGYIIEFPTAQQDVIEGAAYRNKGSYPVPTGQSGRPTRIFYDPQFFQTSGGLSDLSRMKEAFPEAKFVQVDMDALEDTGILRTKAAAVAKTADPEFWRTANREVIDSLNEDIALWRKQLKTNKTKGGQAALNANIASHQATIAKMEEGLKESSPGMQRWLEDANAKISSGLNVEARDAIIRENRATQAIGALDQQMADDATRIGTKYANKNEYVAARIQERREELLAQQGSYESRINLMRAVMKDEAGSLRSKIEDIAGNIRGTRDLRLSELTAANTRTRTAMERNADVAALWEGDMRGGTALDDLSPELQQRILGKPGTKLHYFKRDDWEAVRTFWDNFSHPDDWGQSKIIQTLRGMKNIWAPYVATNPAGFVTRLADWVSNHIVNMFGGGYKDLGQTGRSYAYAESLVRGMRRSLDGVDKPGTLDQIILKRTPEAVAASTDGLESVTLGEMGRFMQSRGHLDSAGPLGEFIVNAGDQMALQSGKIKPHQWLTDIGTIFFPYKRPQNTPYGQFGMDMAKWGDSIGRSAGFIDQWLSGKSLAEASDHVGKWFYDSRRGLTAIERQRIAPFIPFYSWSKFAIARSVETLFKRPGALAWIEHAKDNAFKASFGDSPANENDIDLILPKFVSQQFGIPVRQGDRGPEFFLLGRFMPQSELTQMVGALNQGIGPTAEYVAGKLHPAIKTAIESVANHSFFTDQPLEKFPGEHEEFFGMQLRKRTTIEFLKNFRYLYELDKRNLLGVSESMAMQHGTATDDEPSYLSRLGHSAFGILPRDFPVDAEISLHHAQRDAEQQAGLLSTLLRNRAERNPGALASDKDAKQLQELLSQEVAKSYRLGGLAEAWHVPPQQRRKAIRQAPLGQDLLK